MKIIAISDTHIPARASELPPDLVDVLDAADLVIHAGDLTDARTLARLESLPRFVGVVGNMDGPAVRSSLKDFEIVEVEGVRIGVAHGWGAPESLPQVLSDHFKDERLDVLVFGHSHRPFRESVNGVLLFNPGSPTDTVFAPYRSYGVLTVAAGAARGEIVRLPAPRSGPEQ